MENKHIELVKKWLADKDSVSQEELKANAMAADVAAKAADVAADAYVNAAAASAAASDAYGAADLPETADAAAESATHWIKTYEEMTNGKEI